MPIAERFARELLGSLRRPRVLLARLMIYSGRLIDSLAIMVMGFDDLIELGRQTYKSPTMVHRFSIAGLESRDLSEDEKAMLELLSGVPGELLLLGVGGGREVLPLARLGYRITGVDFVQAMLDEARQAAACDGVEIQCILQEISRLEVPFGRFDVVWMSNAMYSSIPTVKRRVDMLRRVRKGLKPDGLLVLGFVWDKNREPRPAVQRIRKAFATITRGYVSYEPGDRLWAHSHFIHFFMSREELTSELQQAGFEPVKIVMRSESVFAYAAVKPVDAPIATAKASQHMS